MNSGEMNLLAILGVVGVGAVMVVLVGLFSSRSLKEDGLRRVVKRWLGR